MPFDPTTITGMKVWLDASDSTTVYSDAGTTHANNNDTVWQWNDKSGLGNNAVQATSANRPQYQTATINGLNSIYFDGVTDGMPITGLTPSTAMTTGFSLFIVTKLDDTSARTWSWMMGEQSGDQFFFGKQSGADSFHWSVWNWTTGGVAAGGVLGGGSVHTYELTVENTEVTIWVDGTQQYTVDPTDSTNACTTGWMIGRRGSYSELWKGPYGEIIAYDHVITGTERGNLETYFSNKWLGTGAVNTPQKLMRPNHARIVRSNTT